MQVEFPTRDERQQARESLRAFLVRTWPPERARQNWRDPQAIKGIWRRLVNDHQLSGLCRDDGWGGLQVAVMVAEELGRALCPAPVIGAVIANLALRDASARAALLPGLDGGNVLLVVAAADEQGQGALTIERGNASGQVRFLDVAGATHLLWFADDSLWLVSLASSPMKDDPTLGEPLLTHVVLDAAPAREIAAPPSAPSDRLRRIAALLLAARAHGSARRAFELAVEYAKIRVQFGRPIGSFQMIQSKLADAFIAVEGVRLTLDQAARADDEGDPGAGALKLATVAYASPALRRVVNEAHHVFGAIGYAEEHELPGHFRSVHRDSVRFGGVREAEDQLASHVIASGPVAGANLGPVAEVFRKEVRDWLQANWVGERRNANARRPLQERNFDRSLSADLGRVGWTRLSWPVAAGGQGRSARERLAFVEETTLVDLPTGGHAAASNLIGPALLAHGSPAQQQRFLPAIGAGDLCFCLGYSEPEAGSDLAALRTKAEKVAGGWKITGQKLWTTMAEKADYVFLAARTDPQAARHEGISLFLVPMDSEGITIRPSDALYGSTFCTVFYDEVFVPDDGLLGAPGSGWKILTAALADERILMGAFVIRVWRMFGRMLGALKTTPGPDGRPLAEDRAVRQKIGQFAAEIEVARALLMDSIAIVEDGRVPVHEAAMTKVFSSELMQRLSEAALDFFGSPALLSWDALDAPLDGEIEQSLRQSIMMIVGGGTNEIQRSVIAQRGLGLPR